MELAHIKMVVTDMDGTLLNSKHQVSPLFFDLFDDLKSLKVQFVAASGRQYQSIRDKFNGLHKEMTIVSENGGYIRQGDQELGSLFLDSKEVMSLVPLFRSIPDTYTVLCGKRGAFIETSDLDFHELLAEFYSVYHPVEDLMTLEDESFFKIAIFHAENSERHIYPVVQHLEDHLQVKISGKNWVDISDPMVNKGHAISLLQERLGINASETMVFGDFHNDLEMMEKSEASFAMANAHPSIKEAARFSTTSNDDLGVERIIQQMIEQKRA